MEREHVLGNHGLQSAPQYSMWLMNFSRNIHLLVSGLVEGYYEMHWSHSLPDAIRGYLVSGIKSFWSDRWSWQGLWLSSEWQVVLFRILITICLSKSLTLIVSFNHGNSSVCVLCTIESAPTPGDPMNEWCPQCPVLSSLLRSCRRVPLTSFMESVPLILGLPLFLLSSVFPSIIISSKEPCFLIMCLR